jgi:hypothetical protein
LARPFAPEKIKILILFKRAYERISELFTEQTNRQANKRKMLIKKIIKQANIYVLQTTEALLHSFPL